MLGMLSSHYLNKLLEIYCLRVVNIDLKQERRNMITIN